MKKNKDAQPQIQSIVRAVAILKCFSGGKERGLTEVSKMVGLHKSTTSGLVNTLKAVRFLEQNPRTSKYRLGLELFTLAVNARRNLAMVCDPHLDKLRDMTGETVNLAVLDSDRPEIVYITKKESSQSIHISTSVGKRLPIHCTAMGKSILANMDRQRADDMIDRLELLPFTERTITDKSLLRAELDIVAERGYAFDDGEFERGVVCVAAPLLNSFGDPIGAISVSGLEMRMDTETRQRIASILCDEAAKICSKICHFE